MAKKKAKGKKKKGPSTTQQLSKDDRALKKLVATFKGHAAGHDLATARLRSNHLDTLPEEYRRLVDVDRGLDVHVSCQLVTDVSEDDMRWAFSLLKENMETLYKGSEWGWDERDKLKEMHAEGMHYLFVTTSTSDGSSDGSSDGGGGEKVGFASGLFDLEQGVPVFYLFEVMVTKAMQAKGLGNKLMDVFEMVGAAAKMPTSILTCFTANKKAQSFFERRGYTVSEHSPPEGSGYIIRAKDLTAVTVPPGAGGAKPVETVAAEKTPIDRVGDVAAAACAGGGGAASGRGNDGGGNDDGVGSGAGGGNDSNGGGDVDGDVDDGDGDDDDGDGSNWVSAGYDAVAAGAE